MQLPENKFFIIPGNHDSYTKHFLFNKNNLSKYKEAFNVKEKFPLTKSLNFGDTNIGIVGFDSTYLKMSKDPVKKLGHGLIEKYQYDVADGFLRGKKFDLVIACLHHNPFYTPNMERDWKMLLNDSKTLLTWITKNKVNLILFGHTHEHYTDFIPLRKLIDWLPEKRTFWRYLKDIYVGSNILFDLEHIVIKGQYVKFMDSVAYYWIKAKNKEKSLKPIKEFETKIKFESYLKSLEAYTDFLDDFKSFPKDNKGVIMTGSASQFNSKRKNSYLELKIERKKVKVINYKYDPANANFYNNDKQDVVFNLQ